MNANPPKTVKGKTRSPSRHERLAPKNRVIIATINVGMSTPAIA